RVDADWPACHNALRRARAPARRSARPAAHWPVAGPHILHATTVRCFPTRSPSAFFRLSVQCVAVISNPVLAIHATSTLGELENNDLGHRGGIKKTPRQQTPGDQISHLLELIIAQAKFVPDRRRGRSGRHHVDTHL